MPARRCALLVGSPLKYLPWVTTLVLALGICEVIAKGDRPALVYDGVKTVPIGVAILAPQAVLQVSEFGVRQHHSLPAEYASRYVEK